MATHEPDDCVLLPTASYGAVALIIDPIWQRGGTVLWRAGRRFLGQQHMMMHGLLGNVDRQHTRIPDKKQIWEALLSWLSSATRVARYDAATGPFGTRQQPRFATGDWCSRMGQGAVPLQPPANLLRGGRKQAAYHLPWAVS